LFSPVYILLCLIYSSWCCTYVFVSDSIWFYLVSFGSIQLNSLLSYCSLKYRYTKLLYSVLSRFCWIPTSSSICSISCNCSCSALLHFQIVQDLLEKENVHLRSDLKNSAERMDQIVKECQEKIEASLSLITETSYCV